MKLSLLITLSLAATTVLSAETTGRPLLDGKLQALIAKWNVPGGSVTMLRDNRTVYSRGFGLADSADREPVRADSLFRVASISKSITATSILKLVELGRIRLDDRVFDWLPQYRSSIRDVRAYGVTIRQLLQHSGGWDAMASGIDPVYVTREQLQAVGLSVPPQREEIITFWLGQPLDFAPGTRFAYSNFGYVLLGRVIEAVTKAPYERWVAENILERAGFERPRVAGTLKRERVRGEVVYTDYEGAAPVTSVFSRQPRLVPAPYGGFSLDAQDSAGGWLASAPELARFFSDLVAGKILKPETLALMMQRPGFVPSEAASWYGLGLLVYPGPWGLAIAHDGAFAGTTSLVLHIPGVVTLAAVFNGKPLDYPAFLAEAQEILIEAAQH